MCDYRALYYKLFGKLSDAVELLERGDAQAAGSLLIRVLQEAEEQFLDSDEI